jgi:hypothetical protein
MDVIDERVVDQSKYIVDVALRHFVLYRSFSINGHRYLK